MSTTTTTTTHNASTNDGEIRNYFYEKNFISVSTKKANTFHTYLACLKHAGYYWGSLTYEATERLLSKKESGSFLLRDSKHQNYLLTISFKSENSIYHVRMEHLGNGKFSFQEDFDNYIEPQEILSFIDTLVKKSKENYSFYLKERLNAPAIYVKFLYPVSRFKETPVCTLQHLARFTILNHVRKDNIEKLNLPNKLKAYLNEKKTLTEIDV